jgi:hypothetical protein
MNLIARLVIVAAMLGLAACGSSEVETAPEPAAAAPEAPPAAPAAPAAPAVPQASALCARAAECCNAYVAAMPGGAESGAGAACEALGRITAGDAAESTCQASIDGYRQSMSALGATIPPVCQ